MRRQIARYSAVIRHTNPIYFVGVACVAVSVGLLSGVALSAAETAAKFIVGVIL